MPRAALTTKQRHVLQGLEDAHHHPTARNLADQLETPRFRSANYSYDEVYAQLRALERKGYAERVIGGKAQKWTISALGTQTLLNG